MARKLQIKYLAHENGMTLSHLARQLGMPLSNMSAIASGSRGVSLHLLLKIADILRCDLDELFVGNAALVFEDSNILLLLDLQEKSSHSGQDKSWVHNLTILHRRHYGRYRGT